MNTLIEDYADILFESNDLEKDLCKALNMSELVKRRFRSICQISGLMNQGFPGSNKTTGQLQISATLLYDVFSKHEPKNKLLEQARYEVLNDQLEISRLKSALERGQKQEWIHAHTARPDHWHSLARRTQQPNENEKYWNA